MKTYRISKKNGAAESEKAPCLDTKCSTAPTNNEGGGHCSEREILFSTKADTDRMLQTARIPGLLVRGSAR